MTNHYHYQCKRCFQTTRKWSEESQYSDTDDTEESTDSDKYYGGAIDDCGCGQRSDDSYID